MIIGCISITDFPFYKDSLDFLVSYCNRVIVRFDFLKSNSDVYNDLIEYKNIDLFISKEKWNKNNWRNELLGKVNEYKPNLVIFIDQDEIFKDVFLLTEDISNFVESNKKCMMFYYEMDTKDGYYVDLYPVLPHMKIFKWEKELTYDNYIGQALLTNYYNQKNWFFSKTKILHRCFYTPEITAKKKIELVERDVERKLRVENKRMERRVKSITSNAERKIRGIANKNIQRVKFKSKKG